MLSKQIHYYYVLEQSEMRFLLYDLKLPTPLFLFLTFVEISLSYCPVPLILI